MFQVVRDCVLCCLFVLGIFVVDQCFMNVDNSGELFYVEEGLVVDVVLVLDDVLVIFMVLFDIDVFKLYFNLFVDNIIFFDFDGGVFSGRVWGVGVYYDIQFFDLDGNFISFNDIEWVCIYEIWMWIVDDFVVFNVNVIIEVLDEFGFNIGWLLFIKDCDKNGNVMFSQGVGGVVYIGVWGRSNYIYYQFVLVYYNQLGGGVVIYMVEVGFYEMGYNFGLVYDGIFMISYFCGLGRDSDLLSWVLIMGVGYNKNVIQWSKGDYLDVN